MTTIVDFGGVCDMVIEVFVNDFRVYNVQWCITKYVIRMRYR